MPGLGLVLHPGGFSCGASWQVYKAQRRSLEMELGFSEPRFSHLRDGYQHPDEEASGLRLCPAASDTTICRSPASPPSLLRCHSVRTPSTTVQGMWQRQGLARDLPAPSSSHRQTQSVTRALPSQMPTPVPCLQGLPEGRGPPESPPATPPSLSSDYRSP